MGEAWPCQLPCPAAKVPGVVSWAHTSPQDTSGRAAAAAYAEARVLCPCRGREGGP